MTFQFNADPEYIESIINPRYRITLKIYNPDLENDEDGPYQNETYSIPFNYEKMQADPLKTMNEDRTLRKILEKNITDRMKVLAEVKCFDRIGPKAYYDVDPIRHCLIPHIPTFRA